MPDNGVVEVRWRGGPTASTVAAALISAADPNIPVVNRTELCRKSPSIAVLDAGDVRISLAAFDPAPEQTVPQVAEPQEGWSWDWSLFKHGATFDSVLWRAPTATEPSAATVVSVSTAAVHDSRYLERGFLVVNLDYELPQHASNATRKTWKRHLACADIRVRNRPDWSFDEADEWLSTDTRTQPKSGPATSAVLLPDQCVMRFADSGMRVHVARAAGESGRAPWSAVPAAITEAVFQSSDGKLPKTVCVRKFGDPYNKVRFELSTDLVCPWPRDSCV
ncbi:hypothetical protein [Saccharopolyspora hattusasensis]|uniref:hypothetical protein n=1 Tax=Saccharopolyspora hattusasensis TaxID=1128679 RepID=UPI003D980F30